MTRPGAAGTLIWALLVIIAAGIAARATYTADLSAFLPRSPSATQRLLVEQLRTGPAARLILVALEGADARTRARLSVQLARELRSDPHFITVNNGDAASLERDREFLFRHRYLLSETVTPQRFTVAGLHAAIADSLDLLASPEGALFKPLFTRDPTGEMLGILEALGPGRGPRTTEGVWSSRDGARALLIVQTRAAGSDTDAQQAACQAIRRAFASSLATIPAADRRGTTLLMSGPPVFAVASRAIIKGEVMRLSGVSAALIALLLLSVYRSLPALLLTLVPVASGALAGVAAVALGFDTVHGIILGFGITLIGEAVDYSIYLFIQGAAHWRHSVWPTIRLGVLTSICGFAALLPSAFPGLAQLGLYSVTGLVAAALVTRFVLPGWLPRTFAIRDLSALGERLARAVHKLRSVRGALLLVPVLAGAALYVHRDTLWNRELSALNPIPAADQALDEQLRADAGAGATYVRYVIVASAPDRESALAAAHTLGALLTPLIDQGVIGGFESPARYLPPLAVQRTRRASLPAPSELSARLQEAVAGLPVSAARLQPFLLDVERARTAAPLTGADLEGTSLGAAAEGLLVQSAGGWSALLPLSAVASPDFSASALARVRAALAQERSVHAALLDLIGEADRLYSGYLSEAVQLAIAGFGAIVLLLWVALRSFARVARVVAPLALSVLAVAGLLVALGERLTILHVVGMLLIVAVGSNYALFFDRSSAQPRQGSVPLTLASLLIANTATVLTFGVLACSRVPVLADLGSTVAPGTLLARPPATPDAAPTDGS
ncbi:MAG TPA: MMPL family transporter [Steroidobacteraceae bacterium]|nr:MMPL family transporter [Steroidobacteraceae bacterium]